MHMEDNGRELKHLRELIETKHDMSTNALEKALELQAREYMRRLDDLNHEAERLRIMQTTYLPREIYITQHNVVERKIEEIQKLVYIGAGVIMVLQVVLMFLR